MIDYLETGKWISPRDALPAERENVLVMVNGHPAVAYMAKSVWHVYGWPSLQTQTIGSTQAVDRWMHIPPAGPQPETQVLVEALGASVNSLSLRRLDMQRLGDPPEPVIFHGANIDFDGAFDWVGPIENRLITRLRLVAEYGP